MVQYWLIVIAAVLVLFFVVQLLAQYQIIHKKSKIFLGIVLLLIAVGIGIFTAMQDKQDVKMTNLAQLFLQGKELICIVGIEKLEVSKETFNFISEKVKQDIARFIHTEKNKRVIRSKIKK